MENKGQISPLKPIADTNRDEIGRWMGGIGYDRNNSVLKYSPTVDVR